jgi:hypothetical protein
MSGGDVRVALISIALFTGCSAMKASGFVAQAIERHKQPSAVVAPPGDPQ